MKIKHSSVLFLTLLGAAAGFPQVILNPVPARAIGQPILIPESGNPNLVEGRELFGPQGIAVDNSVSPPIVYVADTGNNRVLAWKNAASFSNGAMADLVIGQPDRFSTVAYGPGTTFSTGLNAPTGLAARNGDLYVVDSGNNRVLRYPKPFSQTGQVFPDLYAGQPSLNSRVPNQPNGQVNAQGIYTAGSSQVFVANIAFDSAGNLWLTDPGNRRVLEFRAADVAKGGGGLTAAIEIGQVDFVSTQKNLDPANVNSQLVTNQFAVPDGIAFDAAGNLYVSDSDLSGSALLGRVLVFTPPLLAAPPGRSRRPSIRPATRSAVQCLRPGVGGGQRNAQRNRLSADWQTSNRDCSRSPIRRWVRCRRPCGRRPGLPVPFRRLLPGPARL